MRTLKIDLSILMLLLLFAGTTVYGQQEEVKTEKKVVIITKTVDENGTVKTEKIVKEGADADVFILEKGEEDGIHQHKTIEVDVDRDGSSFEKEIRIRIDKGEGDDKEVIEWSGEGEMPEELLKMLDEKGIKLEIDGDHNIFHFDTNDAPNNACLGVMIGKTETVENINGEETRITEGESDLGVPILDIIEDSGAEDAGLAKEDIITQINGTAVSTIEEVLDVLAPLEPGATISIDYLRSGQATQVDATLKACGNQVIKEVEEEIEWESGADNNIDTEIERTLDLETIDIFPNPTDGKLTIQFTAPAVPTTINVTDMSGRKVYRESLNTFDGKYNKTIDLGKISKGALILSIQQDDKVFSERLILQK